MAAAYGTDLRKRVVEAVEGGLSLRVAARQFSVGVSTVGTWHRYWRKTGSYEPQPRGGRDGSVLDPHKAFIMGLIAEQADITLAQMADRVLKEHELRVDPSTIWHFLKRCGMTYKKRQRMPVNKSARM